MTTWRPLPRLAHNPVYEFTADVNGHSVTRDLNTIMEFDRVVYVDDDGYVSDGKHAGPSFTQSVDAPDMVYVELDADGQMVGSDSRDGLDVIVDTGLGDWRPMQGHCGAQGEGPSMTAESFNPDRHQDSYAVELRELVMSKIDDETAPDDVSDLLAKLEASVKPSAEPVKKPCKADIRTWARSQGYKVGDRGRIPRDIVDKFEMATA